ncbi:hypothetical protein VE02_07068 [Pseudogymnoascus sp. 03VT05]|nr:hypothetical protein VE02_07068 [Pseudogymnoascus sp. 03VT05]
MILAVPKSRATLPPPKSTHPHTGHVFSLATIGNASVGPIYDPLAQWAANTFTRDNPVTDFLFEIGPVENPTEKGPTSEKKTTRKKSTEKKSTQKQQAAHNKSTEKKPAHKKPKTK